MSDDATRPGSPYGDLPFWLEITLFETSGALGNTGQHSLSGRFCAQFKRDGQVAEAVASIVSREPMSQTWQAFERSAPPEQAIAIARTVQALGVPQKQPAVEATPDTSDGWSHLAVTIRVNEHSVRVDLPMQCSGFGGTDAELFRSMLRQVFLAAGCSEWSRSTLGPQPDSADATDPAATIPAAPPPLPQPDGAPRFCGYCRHEVGAQSYEAGGQSCPNCQKSLWPIHSTCVSAPCGHLVPLGPPHCWICGQATA